MIRRREVIKGGGEPLKSNRKAIHVNGEALKGSMEALKDNKGGKGRRCDVKRRPSGPKDRRQ